MTFYTDTFPTPFGPFSVAVDASGALAATAFGDIAILRRRLPRIRFELVRDPQKAGPVRRQVEAYAAGRRRSFDLPLAPYGTAFQRKVWRALERLPFGTTTSYGALASSLRLPRAARAVGRANATNPICLVVPCHRVVGADGSLTGFAFGEDIKRRLLDHESAAVAGR